MFMLAAHCLPLTSGLQIYSYKKLRYVVLSKDKVGYFSQAFEVWVLTVLVCLIYLVSDVDREPYIYIYI